MSDPLYIRAWSAWAPGLEERMAWMTWARGEGEGPRSERSSPALPHVDGLFKRRLSQLSRMTMHVGHEVAEGGVKAKTTFCSVYGEIVQQYRISTKLVESGEVSPAAFSLSVFNTPVAALSIAESNVEGYTAVYPGIDAFAVGLMEAAASIASGREVERVLIAADELLPDPFMALEGGANIPYALALRLGASGEPVAFALDLSEIERRSWRDASIPEALAFLRFTLA